MTVTDTEFELTIAPSIGRSTGLHQSDIVRAVAFDMGYLDKKYDNLALDPYKIHLGLAWEEHLERAIKGVAAVHPEIAMHPGEKAKDGITVSVDGISYQDIEVDGTSVTMTMPVVHEIKCTWYSMPRDPLELISDNKWWMYRAQMMNGCHVWGTRFAKLHPIFVNGDYGWFYGRPEGKGCTYKVYEFTFEQHEIIGNWNMLRKYVERNPGKFPQYEGAIK